MTEEKLSYGVTAKIDPICKNCDDLMHDRVPERFCSGCGTSLKSRVFKAFKAGNVFCLDCFEKNKWSEKHEK